MCVCARALVCVCVCVCVCVYVCACVHGAIALSFVGGVAIVYHNKLTL